jgi:predicted ATPase/DNA-binding winged helix-turn-helix (wHTH) protein
VTAAQGRRSVYASGGWVVDLARRELRFHGAPAPIGSRSFDIFEVLVQSAGELVTKDDLMGRVWSGAIVDENALQVHISAIRKALGPDRGMLKTAFGRGYRLLGTWTMRQERTPTVSVALEPTQVRGQQGLTGLPAATFELIGRTAATLHLRDLLSAYRVVTLSGPGGIGKTTLALEVARNLSPTFSGDVWLVGLASLSDPGLVPSTVAGALGLSLGGDQITPESVARAIAGRKLLLVLDNCEHVIEAVARVVEAIVSTCPATSVITTSREVLRVAGECSFHVPPLDVPSEAQESRDVLLSHSAVRLFIARTTASGSELTPDREDLSAIASICRRLDGIPLAIEFAAACAATLGPRYVASRLDDRFGLLTGGRRTALPRHRTLRATLDWSYDLLSESEQCVLRRLSVFSAGFTLEAATAVLSETGDASANVPVLIANLVAKSLVTVDRSVFEGRWRLLETIRTYAFERLTKSGEAELAARKHAAFFCDLLAPTGDSPARLAIEDLPRYGREIDNVRGVLDWSFSPTGDSAIGVVLTVAYVPVWLHLSLMTECRDRVQHALDSLDPASIRTAHLRMQLHIALGIVLQHTTGPVPRTEVDLVKALAIAESLNDAENQLLALWALWFYRLNKGEPWKGQLLAERFSEVARRTGDPANLLLGDRLMGNSLHFRGNQPEARRYFEHVLEFYVTPGDRFRSIWFLYDMRVAVQLVLARVLMLQGLYDQANDNAHASLAHAQAAGHNLSVCYAHAWAVYPIALMTGDIAAAERSVATVIDLAARHSFAYWTNIGRCLEGQLLIKRGHSAEGTVLLRAAMKSYIGTGWMTRYSEFLGVLAEGLGDEGRVGEANVVIAEALDWSDRTGERYYVAELLRVRGELLLQEAGEGSVPAAEDCFQRALELARQQGALSWELGSALSLARLRVRQKRHAHARQLLEPVCDRFTGGIESADLRSARLMLQSLSSHSIGCGCA